MPVVLELIKLRCPISVIHQLLLQTAYQLVPENDTHNYAGMLSGAVQHLEVISTFLNKEKPRNEKLIQTIHQAPNELSY
jgi:hypothetical protein